MSGDAAKAVWDLSKRIIAAEFPRFPRRGYKEYIAVRGIEAGLELAFQHPEYAHAIYRSYRAAIHNDGLVDEFVQEHPLTFVSEVA